MATTIAPTSSSTDRHEAASDSEWREHQSSERYQRSLEAQADALLSSTVEVFNEHDEVVEVPYEEWDAEAARKLVHDAGHPPAASGTLIPTGIFYVERGSSGSRHRRASGSSPTRTHGSRRSGSRAGSSSSDDPPGESDSDADGVLECAADDCDKRFERKGKKKFCSRTCCNRQAQNNRRHPGLTAEQRADLADAKVEPPEPPNGEEDRRRERVRKHARALLTEGKLLYPTAIINDRRDGSQILPPRYPDGELAWVEEQADQTCGCNGTHIRAGGHCFKCARPLPADYDPKAERIKKLLQERLKVRVGNTSLMGSELVGEVQP